MSGHAALLLPTLRWDAEGGFEKLRDGIEDAIELGVGGFLISGGPRADVARLTDELRRRSALPLLLAADVERGAGQQFDGCLGLPPLSALASANDADQLRRAARITAGELKQLGCNWALAPVCDLDLEPGSAIVGTRGAGSDAARVGAFVAEWIDACQAEGVLACAKHFPGHGRAMEDSHLTLPSVLAPADRLHHDDLQPFIAAIDAGVASVMTAHVAYPALDPSGAPATLSGPILTQLLRHELAFDGLVVSDALDMQGLLTHGAELSNAVRAIAAGCDLLLGVRDLTGVARALERAEQTGVLAAERVRAARERRQRWSLWGAASSARETTLDDTMWARRCADRSVHLLRGVQPQLGHSVELVEVDDDAGGAWPVTNRAHFTRVLRELEVEVWGVTQPSRDSRVPVLIAAYADVVAWKGTAGFSAASCAFVARTIALAELDHRTALLVLFAHPRYAAQFPSARTVLCAWGGEAPSQVAAARALALP